MKTSLKIFLLAAALIVMNGCSAQKRAERHIRKAVALCPELAQVKAHPIDTVLTAPGWADCTHVSLPKLLQGDTLYAATEHGTVVVSLSRSDSSLRVGFVAVPQKIRYKDTLPYRQVVVPESPAYSKGRFWSSLALWIGGTSFGLALCLWLIGWAVKDKHCFK